MKGKARQHHAGLFALLVFAAAANNRSMSRHYGQASSLCGFGHLQDVHLEHYDSWKMTLHVERSRTRKTTATPLCRL